MSTLLLKFATLAIRTASKPLAKRFEKYVMSHPAFRSYVLRVAQSIHTWEARRAHALAHGDGTKSLYVGEMTDDRALSLASGLVSEAFIFAVAGGAMVFEYDRSQRKELEKKEKDEQFRQFVNQLAERERQELQSQSKRQIELIECMAGRINELETALKAIEDERAARAQAKFLGMFSMGRG